MDSWTVEDSSDAVNSRGRCRWTENSIVYTRRIHKKPHKTSRLNNTATNIASNDGAENHPNTSPPTKVSSPAAAKLPTASASDDTVAPLTPHAAPARPTAPHGNAVDDAVTEPLETLTAKDADSSRQRVLQSLANSNEVQNSKNPTSGGPQNSDGMSPNSISTSSPLSNVQLIREVSGGNGLANADESAEPLVISIVDDKVRFNLAKATRKDEIKKLREKLVSELDVVSRLFKQLEEAKELHLASYNSQNRNNNLSSNSSVARTDLVDRRVFVRVNPKIRSTTLARANSDIGATRIESRLPYNRQLSSARVNEYVEKEKRTPKANQYYRNSEFLLGKDRLPPENVKRLKTNNGRRHGFGSVPVKSMTNLFKSCGSLLQRLMKHKHGWVFNEPVNTQALGLIDYHDIIKQPMDLGTIKTQLSQNRYMSASEFAEDVRLVFQNAMTYNPKGHDVHVMAEQLLRIFEERWAALDAGHNTSWKHQVYQDSGLTNPKAHRRPHVGRTPVPKKPKARDVVKRDMTYDEKQRLSTSLQSLPSEKLDAVVQIIKRRNTALSQNDDEEIEVDIDNVDTETLWELDRFVMNYKKSLSKNKRESELAVQARAGANRAVCLTSTAVTDSWVDSGTAFGKKTAPPAGEGDKLGYNVNSSSSSSDSGSSSSDSDSDSSSANGSDAGHSP